MKALKVHCTRPKGHPFPIVSWLIRFIEQSDVSHAVLELPREKIYHSSFNEVKMEQRLEWEKSNDVRYTYMVYMTDDQYYELVDFVVDFMGKKKGYFRKLFGASLARAYRKITGKQGYNLFASDMKGAVLCSELIRYILERYSSFRIPTYPHGSNFSVTDLIKLMEDNNAKKIIDKR